MPVRLSGSRVSTAQGVHQLAPRCESRCLREESVHVRQRQAGGRPFRFGQPRQLPVHLGAKLFPRHHVAKVRREAFQRVRISGLPGGEKVSGQLLELRDVR